MNKTTKKFLIIYSVSLALCIVSSCFLTYSFLFEYDSDIQHFNYSLPVYISFGFIALNIATAFSAYFITPKYSSINIKAKKTSFAEILFAVLAALLCSLYGVLTLKGEMPTEKAYLIFIKIALCFACTIYFLISAFADKYKDSISYPLLNVFPLALCIIFMVCRYFDSSNSMNSSKLFLFLLKLITFMLYFTFEIALELKKPVSIRKYLFGTSLVISTGGAVTISELITTLFEYNGFEFNLLTDIMFFVIWLYILFKSGKRMFLALDMPLNGTTVKNGTNTTSDPNYIIEEKHIVEIQNTENDENNFNTDNK